MSRGTAAVLPPLHTLLRNSSSTSSGSGSPPGSPRTPLSNDFPTPSFYQDMDAKRRTGPPAPLTILPSLSSSVPSPLTRKPSDERLNISSLLNDRQPRRVEYDGPITPGHPATAQVQPSQVPHHPVAPPPHHHHPATTHGQAPNHPYPAHHPDHGHGSSHQYHPNQVSQGPPQQHMPYPQHYHHHHAGGTAPPHPPPPLSAPLMPASASAAQARGFFSPPPSRHSYEYRPPTANHPDLYVRPDMGRRHTYHPDYPLAYEMGVPMPYAPAYIGMPFDGGLGARAPISRTTKACDACRARKVRCDAGGIPVHPGQPGTCSRCRESGRHCVYTATQKKRGPAPGRPARAQSSGNMTNGARRSSLETAPPLSDRRQTWSATGPPPTSNGVQAANGHSRPHSDYPPQPNGAEPSSWAYHNGCDERDVRHHPYRPPSGPRSATHHRLEARNGWPNQPPTAPPSASQAAPQAQAPPSSSSSFPQHEPRQPPVFEADYSLQPHPSAAWPQQPRRDYPFGPDYTRRSLSPSSGGVRLAPLRRK